MHIQQTWVWQTCAVHGPLNNLDNTTTGKQAQEREFSLVFRTFGTDTADVAQEWNCFCEGRHPLFPLALPERTRERRLELPRDSGAIYRTDGDEGGGVHLAMVSEATKV